MLLYYLIIFSTLLLGFVYERSAENLRKFINTLFFILFISIIGLRKEVGVDWFAYTDMFRRLVSEPFVYNSNELLYKYLNVLSYYAGFGLGMVVFITTVIFAWCSLKGPRIININPYYFFAVVAAYYFVMASLNFIRQGAALALMVVAFSYLINGEKLKFVIFTTIAGLFHTSAFLLMFFVIADLHILIVAISIFSILILVIYFPMERYESYLSSEVENAGLMLRVGYLIFPTLYIISKYKTWLKETLLVKRLYFISIFFAPVLSVLSLISSTIADRVAYYFIMFITLVVMRLAKFDNKVNNKIILSVMFLSSIIALILWSLNSKYIEYYKYNSYLLEWLS